MASRRSADIQNVPRRIGDWLLGSEAQVADGPHRGGVSGRVGAGGRPEYVYLEITGYYLTAMAWLVGRLPDHDPRSALAIERGRGALDWMEAVTSGGRVPATRVHLGGESDDWRNRARFSFDLAMAARGAACFGKMADSERATAIARDLAARLDEIGAEGGVLASHRVLEADDDPPVRWSTRPGPHHIKAAAAVLRLPPGIADQALVQRCRQTVAYWGPALAGAWPCQELHALLYGLEGLIMLGPDGGTGALESIKPPYRRLMDLQGPDGSLPANVDRSGEPRADVLAQALRVGALLRSAGLLQGDDELRRLDALAAALVAHVRPDGGVMFWIGQGQANTWCAIFAQQALAFYDGVGPSAELLV